jgi:hypothetical protein
MSILKWVKVQRDFVKFSKKKRKDKSTCRKLILSQSIKGITVITWCTTKITVEMKQKDKKTIAILRLFPYKEKNLRVQRVFQHQTSDNDINNLSSFQCNQQKIKENRGK